MFRVTLVDGSHILTGFLARGASGRVEVLIHDAGMVAVADVAAIELLNGEQ